MQAGVDNLDAGVSQRPRHHLPPAVVAIQARLRDDDPDLAHAPLPARLRGAFRAPLSRPAQPALARSSLPCPARRALRLARALSPPARSSALASGSIAQGALRPRMLHRQG